MSIENKPIVVLYHDQCMDGFGAAYAAWRRLKDSAAYIPVQYGNPPPDLPGCHTLYILDFSYPRAILQQLREKYQHVTLLDHHKTARADLENFEGAGQAQSFEADVDKPGFFLQFDMGESGASLAWRYFHPKWWLPRLLQYVRDRDLWEWKLGDSREINAAVYSHPQEFAAWDLLDDRMHEDDAMEAIVDEGRGILRAQEKAVQGICKRAWYSELGGYPMIPTVNTAQYQSEVGEALCLLYPHAPFAITYMDISATARAFSLRSRGEFDVSEIAQQYGGGGHKNAAGFVWNHSGIEPVRLAKFAY